MRVLSVQTSNERGGGEYAGVGMLSRLRDAGVDVELLTNDPAVADGSGVPASAISIGPKLSRRTLPRIAIGFVPWLLRLARELRRREYDVLLLHYKKEQLMAALLPRRLRKSLVWAEWGPLPRQMTRGPGRLIYRLAARHTRAIVAVSDSTRDSLVAAGLPAGKITVVRSAIDPDRIAFDSDARERYRAEWGAAPETLVVGLVARLSAAKRNEVAIDALAHLPEDVMLVIAGSGEEEDALRARAERYGERVIFLPTPRGFVQEVLSACDVVVFAPHVTEGAPRAIAFGHLVGRPVVATADAGTEELEPGTGTIVSPPHDPSSLAAVLAQYREDPERREREGATARRLAASRYEVEAATAVLLAVFLGAAGL